MVRSAVPGAASVNARFRRSALMGGAWSVSARPRPAGDSRALATAGAFAARAGSPMTGPVSESVNRRSAAAVMAAAPASQSLGRLNRPLLVVATGPAPLLDVRAIGGRHTRNVERGAAA